MGKDYTDAQKEATKNTERNWKPYIRVKPEEAERFKRDAYLMVISFNMRELYLYRRTKDFKRIKITLVSINRIFQDELSVKNMNKIFPSDHEKPDRHIHQQRNWLHFQEA